MRYTTILDLRDWEDLYANMNIRLVYMHLALVAEYHDTNKDLTTISVRKLSEDCGLSVSAVRHALQQLEKNRIIKRRRIDRGKMVTWVCKYLKEQPITSRASKKNGVIREEVPSTRNPNAITREEYQKRKEQDKQSNES